MNEDIKAQSSIEINGFAADDVETLEALRKSAVRVHPVTIECMGLNVKVGKAEILKDVSVMFKPGTTTALQGPSGAGKTTLLNVLSGRQSDYIVSCKRLLVNSKPLERKVIAQLSSLVPQEDVLIPVLSPRETLYFTSKLLFKGSEEEHNQRVNDVINMLSLQHCADVFNGSQDVKGISGGEKKRCSIGIELITNPSCLFLDEPTSGLDSKVALDVIKVLQNLASQGRTIVCTIHQPNFEMFSKFNKLVLLNRGELVYFGEVSLVPSYFSKIGFPVPQFSNPADHILQIVSEVNNDFPQLFRASDIGKQAFKELDDFSEASLKALETDKDIDSDELFSKKGTTALNQMQILVRRAVHVTLKDKKQFFMRSIQLVIMALIIGLSYLQLDRKQTAVFDRQAAILFTATFTIMTTIMGTIIAIPMERTNLKREINNGFYSATVFFFARLLVFYIFQAWYLLLFVLLGYNMIGFTLAPAVHIFIFYATLYLMGCAAVNIGFLFGAVFPNVEQAVSVIPTIIIPFMLFSGLFVAPENIPVYFVWVYYISFVQYTFQILMVNEFENLEFKACTEEQRLSEGVCPLGACSEDPFNLSVPAEKCPGTIVLDNLDYDIDRQWINWLILVALFFCFGFMAYIALVRFLRKS